MNSISPGGLLEGVAIILLLMVFVGGPTVFFAVSQMQDFRNRHTLPPNASLRELREERQALLAERQRLLAYENLSYQFSGAELALDLGFAIHASELAEISERLLPECEARIAELEAASPGE